MREEKDEFRCTCPEKRLTTRGKKSVIFRPAGKESPTVFGKKKTSLPFMEREGKEGKKRLSLDP